MRLGVVIEMSEDVETEFRTLTSLGIETCQVVCWEPDHYLPERAIALDAARRETGVEITALCCLWTGPQIWDLLDGPSTLGIVPVAYRAKRIDELVAGAQFARAIGVTDVVTHLGFIPEHAGDPAYPGLVASLRYLLDRFAGEGRRLLLETGQETPVTLRRIIEDVARPNIGVNFDTANLVLYGKGNPVDALDVLGRYVGGVHAKDGFYPSSGRDLGRQVPLGQGKVDIEAVVRGLDALGYDGALTIEREIVEDEDGRLVAARLSKGDTLIGDIAAARDLLLGVLQRIQTEGGHVALGSLVPTAVVRDGAGVRT